MAAAQLNFNEETLDHSTGLYDLYSRLYNGMVAANNVDAPDYTTNPPTTQQGEIDTAEIATRLAAYTEILMKNSAYMFANAIMSAVSSDGNGGAAGVGFLSRNGDSMVGSLNALYGFYAGVQNNKIFDVYINSNKKYAKVYGSLVVDEDATITGKLNMSNSGIYFGNNQAIYIDNSGKLNIKYTNIKLDGAIESTGNITLGDLIISSNGIELDGDEFYHEGNSNISTVDWSMKDGHVYGDLLVDDELTVGGVVSFLHGFQLGEFGSRMLYSVQDDVNNQVASVHLNADLCIDNSRSIKFNNKAIVKVTSGVNPVVSFSAPGMVMNLGDSDRGTDTTKIQLKAGIYDYSGTYSIVSKLGDGNFPNSLSAGCGNGSPTVLQTYYVSSGNCGVVFPRIIRLGTSTGPSIYTNGSLSEIHFSSPYTTVVNNVQQTNWLEFYSKFIQTTSLFRNQSLTSSATLQLVTDAEFFQFSKPVEVPSISIISNTYKTRLTENALFFADSVFIEGITGGMHHNGNSTFTGSLSSVRFASGFAGYGWAINESMLYGGIAATFDELTIRKKMRVYELEVQKISVTNGSLWVSDACSGDIVEEIM